jgi:hypothetical protein
VTRGPAPRELRIHRCGEHDRSRSGHEVRRSGARANVSADSFFARGAAAVTLIEALERAGFRVQVDMISLTTDGAAGRVRLACRLKLPGEVVPLDKLAFCFAHPALHRRLNFALRLKHAGWIGGSIDVPVEERGDISIDAADTRSNQSWLDATKAQQWVIAQLARQGVRIQTAENRGVARQTPALHP